MDTLWRTLVLVGAVNWGLTGIGMIANTNLNVVNLIVGTWPMLEAIVYILVGVGAILMIVIKA